jgi:hypothetical protein
MTTLDRIDHTIASAITFKRLENVSNLQEILNDILLNYEIEDGVFKLIKEYCHNCEKKLQRKGKYTKDITLPEFMGSGKLRVRYIGTARR